MIKEICKCECHQKNKMIMHFMSCCKFTYLKYINEDGVIDMERYNKIIENNKKKEEK